MVQYKFTYFITNGNKRDLFLLPIKIKLPLIVTNVSFRVVTLIQQEELMGWHSSVVKRTRIRVFGVNFSDFWAGKRNFSSSRRGVRVIGVLLYVCERYRDQYPGS